MNRYWPMLLTLAAVLVLVTIVFPGFLSVGFSGDRLVGSPIDVLKRGAPVALLAIGMTLVIATGGIDLSVGAVMAICGAAAAFAIDQGLGLGAAIPLALAAGLLWLATRGGSGGLEVAADPSLILRTGAAILVLALVSSVASMRRVAHLDPAAATQRQAGGGLE